jgi:hemolysin III
MQQTPRIPDRDQTGGEEIANSISHGLGLLFAIAALPILVVSAARNGGAASVVGASLFAGTMIVLYFSSMLYHALPQGAAKSFFNRIDHAAIFLFIAGSYMPFVLGVLRGPSGWALFGAIWAVAVFGIAAKLFNRLKHPLWSTGLYVAMGWMAVAAAVPLYQRVPVAGLLWLIAGGLFYTAGAVVFLFDSRVRYAHFVWHIFVLGGSVCHFFAALWYAH